VIALIRRRHEGPGWQVFTELADGVGARARRRADVVAMGMYPSRGMEIHGYECKISRRDTRRELLDVSKTDAVGKYCDFWWLTVSDPAIIDGLLIPPTWGILTPVNRVLRVVRRAKKRKAAPLDRFFVAAMLRSVTKHWVPRTQHDEVLNQRNQDINQAIQTERQHSKEGDTRALEALAAKVKAFEAASGIEIAHGWHFPEVGRAVNLLVDAMRSSDRQGLEIKAVTMERTATMFADYAKDSRQRAQAVRALIEELTPQGAQSSPAPADTINGEQGVRTE